MKISYYSYKVDERNDYSSYIILGYNYWRSKTYQSRRFPKKESYSFINIEIILFHRSFNIEIQYNKREIILTEEQEKLYNENERKIMELNKLLEGK